MMRRRLAAALLAWPVLAPWGPKPARASSSARPSGAISLEAEDETQVLEQPFRPSVTFTLKPGKMGPWAADSGMEFLQDIRRWQLQIFDFDDRKVDFIQGVGRPRAARIDWDGIGFDGRLLRDGFYTVRFVWTDRAGVTRRSEDVKVGLLTPPGPQDFLTRQVRLVYTADGLMIRMTEEMAFDSGVWGLQPKAVATLERIVKFLRRYPRNQLLVLGHSDVTGSDTINRMISLRRANAISRFLIEHGIDPKRLSFRGLGSTQPITSDDTPDGRRRSRRVEIVLLRITG